MFNSYKIIALFFGVSLVFSTIADVGNPLEEVETEHNGSPDANLTIFTLDGSGSQAAVTYEWVQVSGPAIEDFTDINNNGIWDEAEFFTDENGDGIYNFGESYIDADNSGDWTPQEDFEDENGNGVYDFELVVEDENSAAWSDRFIDEDFEDENGNGVYDIGEPYSDTNNNGQWNVGNPAIVTFKSAVEYNQEPKIYKFKLTITNSNNQSVSDTKVVIVKPEINNAPIITLKNLDSYIEEYTDINGNGSWDEGEEFIDLNENGVCDQEYSIECGGSTEGGEDGFECVLLFLDDTYVESVEDPEEDVLSYFWENNEGQISTQLYSFEFESPSESHQLRIVATDAYADVSEVVLNVKSSIVNTVPQITLNELYDDVDENSTIIIEAQIVDDEHLLEEIEFVWNWECSGCDESQDYLSNPSFNQSNGTASIEFNAPDILCNTDEEHPDTQFTVSLIARDPFQQSDSDLEISQASTTIIVNNINEAPQIVGVLNTFENIEEDSAFPITINDFDILDLDDCSGGWNLSVVTGGSNYTIDQISGTNYITILNPIDSETGKEMYSDTFNQDINIRVIDSELAITNYTFSVSVDPINDVPEIGSPSALLAIEDQEDFILNVEDLDPQDPDSDNFSIIFPEDLPEGIFSINSNQIAFQDHFFGSISFMVSISDGDAISEPENITINIASVNDAPVYIGASNNFFLEEDFEDMVLFDFIDEFEDVDLILDDEESLTYTLEYNDEDNLTSIDLGYAYLNIEESDSIEGLRISSIANLYSEQNESGVFQQDQIVTVATDVGLMYAQNSFGITVLPQNDMPIAISGVDSLGMTTNIDNQTSILIDLTTINSSNLDEDGNSLYDTPYVEDIDGDNWEINVISGPLNGSISDLTATSFVYYPNPGFRCIDQIEYEVTDSGFDYIYNDLTGEIEQVSNPLTSEPGLIQIIVDFCNTPPFIISSDSESLNDISFLEDGVINVDSDLDLDLFTFGDNDQGEDFTDINDNGSWDEGEVFIDINSNGIYDGADEVVSIHAINWVDSNQNNQWDEGEDYYDCGQDGLCFNHPDYIAPDAGESYSKYIVEAECSLGTDYLDQQQCEYNGGEWATTIVFLPNYNGPIQILIQANDGKESFNLSEPYLIDLFVDPVNDAPLVVDVFLIDENGNELIDDDGNRINYLTEDDSSNPFLIIFEDIDADSELNFEPFNTEDLFWSISDYNGNINDQKIYSSLDDSEISSSIKGGQIDSLKNNWNGSDFFEINVRDLNNVTNSYIFNIDVKPDNDLPYNFSVNIYEDLDENLDYPTFIYEDLVEVEDFNDNNYKSIKYSIFYDDIDSDLSLNQYDGYQFIPDNIIFEEIYEGANILNFNINNEIEADLNSLVYNTDIFFDQLRDNWNGFDSIPVIVSSIEPEVKLDTLLFPLEVMPLNDSPEEFSIYAKLYTYPLDEEAFYYPCDGQTDDCSEWIHNAEFSVGDNFFTLHNDPISVDESIAYDSRFDSGKLLFKWGRGYDVDADPMVSEYFSPKLYYRIELFESNQSDYYYVLDEIDDSVFDNNACDVFLEENSSASDELCQGFMNDEGFGWGIVDMQQLFFRYKNGFYDHPDINPDVDGFLTTIDSTKTEFSYGYLDISGNTEYEWRVVAYNRWWDSRAPYNEYTQNEESISNSDTEDMRFFMDLERPEANFSIVQNPLYHELYELYITTDEDIKNQELGISNSDGDIQFGNILDPITPCTDNDNDGECGSEDYYNAYYYAGEFDSQRVYKYTLHAFDVLGNAGITDYAITYSYLLPGTFSLIKSPTEIAELVIFDYSLSHPASIILSEKELAYEDIGMVAISNEIDVISNDLDLQSSIGLRFVNNGIEFESSNLIICKKDQFGSWLPLETDVFDGFIQSDISSAGTYALFYIENSSFTLPEEFELIGCFPNPFNPDINIQFSVPYLTDVKLSIYDIAGKKVRSLLNQDVEPGIINTSWNGISDNGDFSSSGIYFVVLDMNNSRYINKVTLLK